MKPISIFTYLHLAILLVFFYGCAGGDSQQVKEEREAAKQEIAEEAVKAWMIKSNDYPHYKPVVFGDLTPRYEKSTRTLQLSIEIANEEAIRNTADNKHKLDSLKAEIAKYKSDMLGYLLPHKFQEQNMAGEIINRELLFFLDTSLRVASALPPESFDYILDEKVFFRPDKDFE